MNDPTKATIDGAMLQTAGLLEMLAGYCRMRAVMYVDDGSAREAIAITRAAYEGVAAKIQLGLEGINLSEAALDAADLGDFAEAERLLSKVGKLGKDIIEDTARENGKG